MKRMALLGMVVALSLSFGSGAFAFGCPGLMKQIDGKAGAANLSTADAKKVAELREQGERQHKSGDHAKSMESLRQALAIIGG